MIFTRENEILSHPLTFFSISIIFFNLSGSVKNATTYNFRHTKKGNKIKIL